MNRSGLIITALVTLALAGCGTAGGGAAAPADQAPAATSALPTEPPPVDERFTSDIPAELRVRDPKDARGVDVCDLLTSEQLVVLGLNPRSARSDAALYGHTCSWKFADGSTSAGVALSVDPDGSKLPDLYRLRSAFHNVEVLQIAGHPAMRADDVPVGECTLHVAIADEQVVAVDGYLDDREPADPCAMARRMAELILSNLPPKA